MRRRRSRVYHTASGQLTRLGFDDPLRWIRHLARRAIKRMSRALTTPAALAGALAAFAAISVFMLAPPALHGLADGATVPAPLAARPVAKASERAPREAPPPAARPGGREAADPAVARHGLALSPPFEIVDGRTFGNADLMVRLSDIAAPERDAVCVGDNGYPWACGLAARAALNNLVRVAPVLCDAVVRPQGPAEGRCRLADGAALAAQLVLLGFARPSQAGALGSELAEAQRLRRGLWNGGWTYRELPAAAP
jgi:endonuclease YncB( thermonuclease family)